MTGKPAALVRLDDTVKHLRNTLRKHKDVVPPSLAATICGFLSRWGRAVHEGATAIAPGREQIAKWSGCADRQAGSNMAVLRYWGFLEVVAHGQGGRHRTTICALNIVALLDALRLLGVKLHPTLVDKLRYQARRGRKGSRNGGNGRPLSGYKPLTSQGNNIAGYTYKGETTRVTRIAPSDHVPSGQEASQEVETQVTSPLDGTPMLDASNQPRDLSPHLDEESLVQLEEVPARGSETGEVVGLDAHRAAREDRRAPDPTPGGNDTTEPFVGPPEDHRTGGNAPDNLLGVRRVGRHE